MRRCTVSEPLALVLLVAVPVLALAALLVPAPAAGAAPGPAEVRAEGAEAGQAAAEGTPPQGADGPRYVDRLDLPVESDRFVSPRSVTADLHTGEVFVADLHRDRVVIFGPDGTFRFQIRGGDVFRAPRDVAVDPQGFLYLAANQGTRDVLMKLDFDGRPVGEIVLSGLEAAAGLEPELPADAVPAEAGEGPDRAADGRPAEPTDEPENAVGLEALRVVSLALSPEGDRLYLLDEANKRLWLAATDGRVTGSVDLAEGLEENRARDLELGHVDVYGDQVLVAMASLGEIHLFDREGDRLGHVGFHGTGPCQLAFPVAAARDAGGDYLVIDQQRMLVLRWSPVGNRCAGEYWGLGGKPGFFYFPFDLALGPPDEGGLPGGDLYVSQGYQGRVQAYTVAEPAAMPKKEDREEDRGEDRREADGGTGDGGR